MAVRQKEDGAERHKDGSENNKNIYIYIYIYIYTCKKDSLFYCISLRNLGQVKLIKEQEILQYPE